jgi:NAD(P)-dependent dehydrogenase (short-subunit alcohol dehydrogenase family)
MITGASSGIGRAAALAISSKGARVVLTGRSEERLIETAAMLAGSGHGVRAAEIGDADSAFDLMKAVANEYGPLDGVFHAAGEYMVLPIKVTKQRHLDQLFGASVFGGYGIARAAAQKALFNDGGSVIIMGSVSSERGHVGLGAYSGAKAAVQGLVRTLALELAPRRIRVNSIIASTIETEMHLRTIANAPKELVDLNESRHPLGFGTPADISNALLFLLSSASSWVTGTAVTVDGGYTAK